MIHEVSKYDAYSFLRLHIKDKNTGQKKKKYLKSYYCHYYRGSFGEIWWVKVGTYSEERVSINGNYWNMKYTKNNMQP